MSEPTQGEGLAPASPVDSGAGSGLVGEKSLSPLPKVRKQSTAADSDIDDDDDNDNITSCNSSSNSRSPLPPVSTPARDPTFLATKRMQRMQLHSPAPAGNSGGGQQFLVAESPMRTFGGPHSNATPNRKHQYDLTPRVQNTSAIFAGTNNNTEDKDPLVFDLDYLDTMEMKPSDEENNGVTLDGRTLAEGSLHGKHLAFPEDLCNRPVFSARPMHPGAILPPLASRGLLPIVKKSGPVGGGSNEVGGSPITSCSDGQGDENANISIKRTSIPDPLPCTRAPEFAHIPPMEDPVPFPPSGKNSYSFTCMEQYEKQRLLCKAAAESNHPTSPTKNKAGQPVKPYQPSRRDVDVEDIPPEELDRIFTPRRGGHSNNNNTDTGDLNRTVTPAAAGLASASTSQDDEEEDDITGLQQRCNIRRNSGAVTDETDLSLCSAIPFEDRQFSIPSIRMAHHVNGSVASFTTYTEEDDESLLMMYRDSDDASLSSLGSYSNHYTTMMLGGGDDEILKNRQSPFVVSLSTKEEPKSCFIEEHVEQPIASTKIQQQQLRHSVIGVDSLKSKEDDNYNAAIPSAASRYHRQKRRQQKQEQRDRNAYEWLRTVTAGNDEVAEAASSKFLTGRANSKDDQDLLRPCAGQRRPLMKRLSVTAGIESKTLAALKDLEKNRGNGKDEGVDGPSGKETVEREDDKSLKAISADEVEYRNRTSSLAIH